MSSENPAKDFEDRPQSFEEIITPEREAELQAQWRENAERARIKRVFGHDFGDVETDAIFKDGGTIKSGRGQVKGLDEVDAEAAATRRPPPRYPAGEFKLEDLKG